MEGAGDGGFIDDFMSVDLEMSALLGSILDRSKTSLSVDQEEEPEGGWDAWCSRVSKKGKIARILRTISKNVMSFEWRGGDERARKKLENLTRSSHMKFKLMQAYRDWQVYGRFFMEIVWEWDGRRLILRKIKVIPPATIKVYRDTREDIAALKMDVRDKTGYKNFFKKLVPGAGDTIIAYVQSTGQFVNNKQETLTDSARRNVGTDQRPDTDYIFFKPDELIFLPRYADHDLPDGISLLRENYDTIMNKLGYERSQSIMVKRHIDPKLIFTIPRDQWGDRRRIQQEIKYGIRAGMDIFIPEGMLINILQSSGMGGGVSEAIQHTEDEFNASLGWADSFSQSDSSNRSVGAIQLEFFNRDIASEREIFTDLVMNRIVKPYVRNNLGNVDIPELEWTDLTPEDRKQNTTLAVPYINMLTISQLLKLMDDIGYPVAQEDLDEFKENVETVRTATLGGGDQGPSFPGDQDQSDEGGIEGFYTPPGGFPGGASKIGTPSNEDFGNLPTPRKVNMESEATNVDLTLVQAKALEALIKKVYELEHDVAKLKGKESE